MSLLEVEGTYRDGKVELDRIPEGVGNVRVRVTFLSQEAAERSAAGSPADRLLAQLEQGLHLGGPPYPRREELYDRFGPENE